MKTSSPALMCSTSHHPCTILQGLKSAMACTLAMSLWLADVKAESAPPASSNILLQPHTRKGEHSRHDAATEESGTNFANSIDLVLTPAAEVVSETPTTLDSNSTLNNHIDSIAPQPELLTLKECLRLTTQDNPSLKAAFARWQGALAKVVQARALPDPKLSYELLTQMETPEHRFGIKQEFPAFGMLRAETDMAVREAKAKEQMFMAQKLVIFDEVKNAFYECEYLAQAIAAEKESIQLMEDIESGMRIRYASGQESHPNLLRLQAELEKMRTELLSMQAMKPVVSARLNVALGRHPTAPSVWPTHEMATLESEALNEIDLQKILTEDSPEIRASRQMVLAAQAERHKAQAGYWPMVMLGVRQMRPEGGPSMGEDNYPVEAMIEFSLPLNYSKNRAALREADARIQETQSEEISMTNKLAMELKDNFYFYQDATRRLDLAQNTLIPKQQDALNSLRRAFGSGKSEYIDVVDAQRNLLAFQLMAERARADRKIRLSALERITGRSLRQAMSEGPLLTTPLK